ncbi:MAG: hypothetical protein ABJH68_09570 [Ilumatobacter sp.]|uniref:hypothetical protein n=1 Tax=Ilumatobacter sp. TaxID=1967498 RepID=UPI003298768D
MTDQQNASDSNDAVINEALGVIDGALAKMMQRDLVSTNEVADLLLDVRTLLTDVNLTDLGRAASAVDVSDITPVTSELA